MISGTLVSDRFIEGDGVILVYLNVVTKHTPAHLSCDIALEILDKVQYLPE